jgi:adenylate cyclase
MERRLAAILAADVVGYSRLMAADEQGTHVRLKALRQDFIEPKIAEYHGRIVKLMGDGALVEFASVVKAVECAATIQSGVAERQAEVPEEERIAFRVGINIGDVIVEESDVYGDGVNVAARLEALAEPGEICVSRTVYNHARAKVAFGFEPMGEHRVKNIPEPVMVYRVVTDPGPLAKVLGLKRAGTRRWRLAALTGAAAVVLLVAGAAGLWLRSDDIGPLAPQQAVTPATVSAAPTVAPQAPLDKYRIAVLPFTNMSADAENEYFSDGMTEELISKLSRLRDLTVIARTSIMQYKDTSKSIGEIGRELQVGTILEGSVRKAGDRLRITAQLVDVASQGHLWSQDYDRTLEDVFAIQSAVAESVAQALQVALKRSEKRQIEKAGTADQEAYDLYLRGLFHYNTYTERGLHTAIKYSERAIQRDRAFARAHALLAWSYELLGFFGFLAPDAAYPKALEAVNESLALNSSLPEAYTVLGLIKIEYYYDWAAAESAFQRAIELDPGAAMPHWLYGASYLSAIGKHDESIAELTRALELDPLSIMINADFGYSYHNKREYDKAVEQWQKTLELDPNIFMALMGLGLTYRAMGDYEKSIESLQKCAELTQRWPGAIALLAAAHAAAGQRARALELLAELQQRAKREQVGSIFFAWTYIGLGDYDRALDMLMRAYEEPAPWLTYVKVWSFYDPLRSDPRFTELLRKVGLESPSN